MNECPECKRDFWGVVRFCPDCGTKLVKKAQSPSNPAPGVNVQDGVVVGGVHITSTDSRTIISHQDETREVLTCAGCGARIRKHIGFT